MLVNVAVLVIDRKIYQRFIPMTTKGVITKQKYYPKLFKERRQNSTYFTFEKK